MDDLETYLEDDPENHNVEGIKNHLYTFTDKAIMLHSNDKKIDKRYLSVQPVHYKFKAGNVSEYIKTKPFKISSADESRKKLMSMFKKK